MIRADLHLVLKLNLSLLLLNTNLITFKPWSHWWSFTRKIGEWVEIQLNRCTHPTWLKISSSTHFRFLLSVSVILPQLYSEALVEDNKNENALVNRAQAYLKLNQYQGNVYCLLTQVTVTVVDYLLKLCYFWVGSYSFGSSPPFPPHTHCEYRRKL